MSGAAIEVLSKILGKIVKPVYQPIKRHVGFLLHYKQNMKNLDDEENNLQKQRGSVQGKVDEANHRGEAINNNVLAWLKNADEARQVVANFRDEKAEKENMLCFNFSCPNFISRYRLSKEANDNKVVQVKRFIEEGGKIENGTVSHPREAPPELEFPSSKDYEGFDSRDKVFEDIVKALKDPEVNRIGVYGTGGVGKTTIVTKVGELVKKDGTFDEVVMAVVSKDANVKKIQGELADLLNPRLDLTLSGETEKGRATGLWNRLNNGKKNLVLLDDVWQQLDLNKIGIPITDENKSCNVVLTSRNRDVLKNMCVHKDFNVSKPRRVEESWALFKKKVENYVPEIARAVCKECQGLPVAINAIGAALKNKDMYAWEDALDKLKNSMLKDVEGIDRKVYASLKWSYDRLDSEDAKSCFLLCCLFPEDAWIQIDDLVRYYMAGKNIRRDKKPDTLEIAFNRVHTVVGTLQSCCLLLDDENYYKDKWKMQDGVREVVKMHDVVRDVAISIAKDEQSFLVNHGVSHWPEKATYDHCSVISLKPNDMLEFPDQLVCQELHTLRLDCTENKFRDQVPERFFSGTENLTVLDLNSVTMSPILPASLAKLAKLQMLCLDGCKLADIAILKDLKDHLEILSLRRSDIEVLPPEVGELTHLRVLDMNSCERLQVIRKGVISKLFRLEELYMPRTFHQWEGTRADGTGRDISCVSLDEIMSLTRLTTLLYVCIRDPALLPKDFTFENLVRFDVEVGRNKYRSYTGNTDSSGVLKLANIHLANPLEGLLGKPKWCRQRNGLYPSKSFNHLTCLLVTDCVTDRSWKYLFSPSSARGLVQLKTLEIESCMDMEGVIGNEGEEDHEDIIPISFSRLNKLILRSLPNLKSFYPNKEKKATSSDSCSAHDAQTVLFTDKHLPVDFVLYASSGHTHTISNLAVPHLEKREEETKEVTNNTIVPFPELTSMELGGLQNIKGFCTITSEEQPVNHAQVAFPKLEELRLDMLGGIVLQQLLGACEPSIKTLCFFGCNELSTVVSPRMFRRLRNVDLLHVESCIGVTEVFHFDELEVGEGQKCVGSLIPVRKIQLETLPKLTCLWNKDPHGLQNLEYLTITDCPLLRNLLTASVAKALGGLKVLYLRSCSTMEEVIATDEGHEEVIDDEEIVFPKLEWLILKDLSNLKSFCSANYNFNLPSLKRVVVKRCPNMQTFTSGSVRMPPTLFTTRGDDGPVIEDLNKHLEQQHLKGDQETIEEHEMRGKEDQFYHLHWDRF